MADDDDDQPVAPSDGKRRKHRHDLGHEDHGAKLAAGTTRTIQALLGLWIGLSLVLVVYVLIDAARPAPSTSSAPSGPAKPSPPTPAQTSPGH